MSINLQKQANRHDPNNGIFGDCHRTAIAMVLQLPRDSVPHFIEKDMRWQDVNTKIQNWLETRGLTEISFPVVASSPQDVLDNWNHFAPKAAYILGGTSANGTNHSVAVWRGKIFDPAIDDSGIVGPMDDGHYWISIFVPIRPSPTGEPPHDPNPR